MSMIILLTDKRTFVIPAKAGTHLLRCDLGETWVMDSRFRWNDDTPYGIFA